MDYLGPPAKHPFSTLERTTPEASLNHFFPRRNPRHPLPTHQKCAKQAPKLPGKIKNSHTAGCWLWVCATPCSLGVMGKLATASPSASPPLQFYVRSLRWHHHGFAAQKPAKTVCGKVYHHRHHRQQQHGDVGHLRRFRMHGAELNTAVYFYDQQMRVEFWSIFFKKKALGTLDPVQQLYP